MRLITGVFYFTDLFRFNSRFKTFIEFSIYQQLRDIGNGIAKREKLSQPSKLKPFREEDIPKKYHLTSLFLLFL